MKKVLTLTALGTILVASNAMAAGFHLREQSAAAQGNAFAGATAGAENASYAYYNAAGLTRHKGTQINMGATYISPRAEAENVKNQDGGREADINNIVHAAWVPNGTISHQVDDKLTVGMSLNVPYGMITKYDEQWAGSDHGVTSKVMSTTVTPMAAYKLTDKLSVGAGLQMQYVKARLTSTAPGTSYKTALQGDTFDVGYQLSALYELDKDTRFGINYRSEINHKLKGEIESSVPVVAGPMHAMLNQDISARLDTPALLSVGAYHQINDKWAVMAEYQRVFWSSFENLDIVGDKYNQPNGLISRTKENWRDTNFFAVGASYQIDDQWKLRLGLAKDEGAARKSQRTPRIPDSDRTWYSAGLTYEYNDKLTFDFAYTYIQAKDAAMDTALTGNGGRHVAADYKNSVKLWGLSLNYKF
ncbi:MAG: transporter [Alphaproteobacteria bacterium]|nr:transporter [Alphaproteobacteria bacterium]